MLKFAVFTSTLFISLVTVCEIYVLGTAALINNQFENRKHEYINAINIVAKFGYQPYIVENCAAAPTFLDTLPANILYSHSNNNHLRNKGINEAVAILAALDHFKFDDDAIIVKFTARYPFGSNSFLRLIENNPNIDAFVKVNNAYSFLHRGDVFTGCFAMRCNYLKQMLNSLDFNYMERNWINIETEVANFVKKMATEGARVMYVDKIDISARVAGYNNMFTSW